ncbi:MAG: efflux RND transporter permease subunit [Chromatiales bacterium]|nr:efflux RND transporter permease subunit [Chromatiales bacterium]
MQDLIRVFVRHPVAPNLAMGVMILAGLWALSQLTRQILPSFEVNIVTVEVIWPGASAEDVKAAVTQPIEDRVRTLDAVQRVSSTSRESSAQVVLEYGQSANMSRALDQVKDAVAQVRNLPADAEAPSVSLLPRQERLARLVVTGPDIETLRPVVRRFERELRAMGIARIDVTGLPLEEIAIELSGSRLTELGLSLEDIGDRIRRASRDTPAGSVGRADVSRQLRGTGQARSVADFEALPLAVDDQGRLLALRDVAEIVRRPREDEPTVFVDGRPAVELLILRAESEDAINVAERVLDWVDRTRSDLPPNVDILMYDEPWRDVADRIDLMLGNALGGMLLVIGVLYLFLNARVAFWVAVGIPIAIMGGLMALYLFGGSLNMISLFAMVMALGIVVDDAIVVGEEAARRYQAGATPLDAAEGAALRMLAPVAAASLTTVAAFVPLMTIDGPGGAVLFAIPLIMICVVIASMIECFLVLPGHLRHALEGTDRKPPSRLRLWLDTSFESFRCGPFRRWSELALRNRSATLAWAIGGLVVAIGLIAGGRIEFTLFPQPDGTTLQAVVRYGAGTPQERVDRFMRDLQVALDVVEREAGEPLTTVRVLKQGVDPRGTRGSHVAHMVVELVPPDARSMSNGEIIRAWRGNVALPAGIESFVILSTVSGPGGSDVELELLGTDPEALKLAAIDVAQALSGFTGVSGVRDDTAYGKEQVIFRISPTGEALGLTSEQLGRQLRAAFEGDRVQIFQDAGEEVEVRVLLADSERRTIGSLDTLPILLPGGETAPLSSVAELGFQRGFESLKQSSGDLAITITANVDEELNNNGAVRALLSRDVLPAVLARDGVTDYRFRGDAEGNTLGSVGTALPLALCLVYIILAWIFASYTWPLAILSVIPFGIVGAVLGHWLMGFDFTLMSIFGLFGLSGIIINDSIILVSVFRELREQGLGVVEAAVEAAVRRCRAVILTSVTTVFGVMPILFETAVQAQFLKPLIISLAFGMIFGTFIVLFVLPAILVSIELRQQRFRRWARQWADQPAPARDPGL